MSTKPTQEATTAAGLNTGASWATWGWLTADAVEMSDTRALHLVVAGDPRSVTGNITDVKTGSGRS
ncbi:hypothetical protein GCM10027075_04980 [Streptomyces heilongjiangensis]